MKYKLNVYSIWEPGQRVDSHGNPHQEDSLYPPHGEPADGCRTFVLCDGMGGHEAGEVASSTVCQTMARSIAGDGHDAEGVFTDGDLSRAIEAAFTALDKHDSPAAHKMGTTMTLVKLHNDGVTMAHIGDSRIYHLRPGDTAATTRVLYESEDHSLVNSLVKMGEMTREEARHSPRKHVITRAMQPGVDLRCKASVFTTPDVRPGDYFYMCSDGMLEDEQMDNGTRLKQIFSGEVADDTTRLKMLIDETAGNKDNHSAFIIHVVDTIDDDSPRQLVKEKPVEAAGDVPAKIISPDHKKLFVIVAAVTFVICLIAHFLLK